MSILSIVSALEGCGARRPGSGLLPLQLLGAGLEHAQHRVLQAAGRRGPLRQGGLEVI